MFVRISEAQILKSLKDSTSSNLEESHAVDFFLEVYHLAYKSWSQNVSDSLKSLVIIEVANYNIDNGDFVNSVYQIKYIKSLILIRDVMRSV